MGFGNPLTNVATQSDLSTVESKVDSVKTKTDNLPAAPANEAGKVSTVETRVTGTTALEATAQSIKTKTDALGLLGGTRIKAAASTGQIILPSGADQINLSPGSGWSFTAWSEVSAGLAYDVYLVAASMFCSTGAGGPYHQVQIGTGAAASEVSKLEVGNYVNSTSPQVYLYPFFTPLFVPSGTRLAARARAAAGCGIQLYLLAVRASDLEAF